MKDMQIHAVEEKGDLLVVSLYGGPENALGSLTFFVPSFMARKSMAAIAERLSVDAEPVSLALNIISKNWRLLNSQGQTTLGGTHMTVLKMSLSDEQDKDWGLEAPWEGED